MPQRCIVIIPETGTRCKNKVLPGTTRCFEHRPRQSGLAKGVEVAKQVGAIAASAGALLKLLEELQKLFGSASSNEGIRAAWTKERKALMKYVEIGRRGQLVFGTRRTPRELTESEHAAVVKRLEPWLKLAAEARKGRTLKG